MLCFGSNTTRDHPADVAHRLRADAMQLMAREARRQARRTTWSIIAGAVVIAVLIGCTKAQVDNWLDDHQATGNAVAQSQTLADVADSQAAKAQRKAKGPTKDLITMARETLAMLKAKLVEVATSHDAEAKSHAEIVADLQKQLDKRDQTIIAKDADYAQLYNSWGAWLERWVRRIFAWIIGYFVLAIGLRLVGLLATGPFGSLAAGVSTVMLGPIAWFQAGFDNVWHRRIAPTLKGSA